jgi:hypothetical protein
VSALDLFDRTLPFNALQTRSVRGPSQWHPGAHSKNLLLVSLAFAAWICIMAAYEIHSFDA